MRWQTVCCVVILGVLTGCHFASANTVYFDDFTAAGFQAGWGLDTPDISRGTITLDTGKHRVQFNALQGIDMWGSRAAAPILWTETPSGDFSVITHVVELPSGQAVAGVTVYGNSVAGADGQNPNFTFGIDSWNNNKVSFQGLGNNNPLISISQNSPTNTGWLKLSLARGAGAGGQDRYTAEYRAQETAAWQPVGTFDRTVDNARIGLFYKTGGPAATATFDSFQITAVPEPSTLGLLLCLGGIGLAGTIYRRYRG